MNLPHFPVPRRLGQLSSTIIPETPSPPTIPPPPPFPEPTSSIEAQPGTHGDAVAPFPTLGLLNVVDLEDDQWRAYLPHCHDTLRKLGHKAPKSSHQLRAMLLVLHRQENWIMLLPTGFGKSLLYQFITKIPAALQLGGRRVGGQTLVISPFIALLQDQVDKAHTLNIPTFNWSARPRGAVSVPSGTHLIFFTTGELHQQDVQRVHIFSSLILCLLISYFQLAPSLGAHRWRAFQSCLH